MALKAEAGLRDYRIEFHRETTQGQANANPAWLTYSDTVRSFEWSPDGSVEQTLGIGIVDPSAFLKGPETHELTISYDLQKALTSGNDAAADGFLRDTDNGPLNTHSFMARESKNSISAEETVNGTTSHDTRTYTVGTGGLVDSVTINGDPGSQNPVLVDVTYQFEKVRTYQIDQPTSATQIDIVSSDAGDTTQTITIGQEDGTEEDVSLNGTTTAQTISTTISDIDYVYISDGSGNPASTTGNVTVSETGGDDLMVIYGSGAYDGLDGDSGVPPLGTGSHEGTLGTAFELIIGDTVTRGGSGLAFDVSSVSIDISNNVETTTRIDTVAQRYHMGTRTIELSANVLGETQSHADIIEHLQVNEANIVWTMSNSTVTLQNCAMTSVGSRSIEAGQATLSLDNTFTARGVSIV